MADNVTVTVLEDGPRNHVVRLTNASDGTGESAVVKIDISTLVGGWGKTPAKLTIDEIVYDINGFNYVTLAYDATDDDEIAQMSGNGHKIFPGGLVDPRSSGAVGDVILTTDGGADGSSYDIEIWARKKD